MTPAEIAAGLTKAQREAVLAPHASGHEADELPPKLAEELWKLGLIYRTWSPAVDAVRAILMEKNDG